MAPIYTTSTYIVENFENLSQKVTYNRLGNPSKHLLEKTLASLDDTKYAIAFSSGQAVTSSLMVLAGTGAHVILCKYVYGFTVKLFM